MILNKEPSLNLNLYCVVWFVCVYAWQLLNNLGLSE